MPVEITGEAGTPGASREWIDAECQLPIKGSNEGGTVRSVCILQKRDLFRLASHHLLWRIAELLVSRDCHCPFREDSRFGLLNLISTPTIGP